jgi:hypothetical protein
LLRIADGLDVRHLGLVNDLTIRREEGRVWIGAQAEADIADELAAARLKADLFERAFGLRVTIEAQPLEVRT